MRCLMIKIFTFLLLMLSPAWALTPQEQSQSYGQQAEHYQAQGDMSKAIMFATLALSYDFSDTNEARAKLYLTGDSQSSLSLKGGKEATLKTLVDAMSSQWNPNTYHRYFAMASVVGMMTEFPYTQETLSKPLTDPVHISVTFDDNYTNHGSVAILSALLAALPSSQYVFHIAEDPESKSLITEDHKRAITQMIAEISPTRFQMQFETFDLGLLPNDLKHVNLKRFPRMILFRPYLAYYYPYMDRLIIMDADIIVRGDFTDYFTQDMKEAWALGARDKTATSILQKLHLSPKEAYLNAGFTLFDLKAMRKSNVKKMLDKTLAPESPLMDKIRYPEQDVYATAFKGHMLEIEDQATKTNLWNWFYAFTKDSHWEKVNSSDFAIIHMAGKRRKPWARWQSPLLWSYWPWRNDGVQNLYWVLREMSPFPAS